MQHGCSVWGGNMVEESGEKRREEKLDDAAIGMQRQERGEMVERSRGKIWEFWRSAWKCFVGSDIWIFDVKNDSHQGHQKREYGGKKHL